MFERILIPTDGSQEMDSVVEKAVSLAADGDAAVHSIYVVDHRSLIPLGEDEQRTVAETLKSEGETVLESVADAVESADADVDVSTSVVQGIPASQILGYAQERDVDAIVMGSHGQTKRNQAIGSTTERVVRGVNQIDDTMIVVVPIGQTGDDVDEQDVTEQARDMFQ